MSNAIRWDAPYRYLVKSQTQKHVRYLVDISSPECQCERFNFNVNPLIKDLTLQEMCHIPDDKWCYHIRAALNQFWEDYARDVCNKNEPFSFLKPIQLERCKLQLSLYIAKLIKNNE